MVVGAVVGEQDAEYEINDDLHLLKNLFFIVLAYSAPLLR